LTPVRNNLTISREYKNLGESWRKGTGRDWVKVRLGPVKVLPSRKAKRLRVGDMTKKGDERNSSKTSTGKKKKKKMQIAWPSASAQ